MKALIADICEIRCDAIVNAANGRGPMGSGVAGAIRRAAGKSVQDAAMQICKDAGWFHEGDCYVSPAGELAKSGVKGIYHAVTMDFPGGRTSLATVGTALRNTLERAIADGVKRIAVPGLGTGIGALPKKSVAMTMVRVARRYSSKIEVVFADIDEEFISYVDEALSAGRQMKTVLDNQVLVLDGKTWEPVNLKTVRWAITDVAKGNAEVLDGTDQYPWDLWQLMEPGINEGTIHTSRQRIRAPKIILLTKDQKGGKRTKHRELKLTRKNIFLRDLFECAYCGRKITVNSGTLDHVHPKSRGGKNSWDNLVGSCFKCNTQKKNRTPGEAGLKLRVKPHKPLWYSFASRLTGGIDQSWVRYLEMDRIPQFCKDHGAVVVA